MTSYLHMLAYGTVLTVALLSAALQPEAGPDWTSADLSPTLVALSNSFDGP